jgi:chorismate mutase
VDRIDLKILKLLQQRINLSTRIGQVKRRHGAAVYVPQREGELRARVASVSRGKLPSEAVDAIYREILSNSRAAQGQAPLGLLRDGAETIMLSARWQFGACDKFVLKKNWEELASGIESGSLTLALLTGEDLAHVLESASVRKHFLAHFSIVGDFSPSLGGEVPLAQRVLIITPRPRDGACLSDRLLILIECKSTVNAVKKLANSMSDRSIHAEDLPMRGKSTRGTATTLVRLALPKRIDPVLATDRLLGASKTLGIEVSLLGVYPGTENYGG